MPTEINSHTGDCGVHHTQPESLVELLGNNYRGIAHKPAIVQVFKGQTVSWSWGEVIRAALELAARFESLGLCRGDLLVHVGKHSADFVVVDIACLLSGIVHVALHSSDTVLRLGDQVRWLSPQGFLVSGLGTPLEPFVNRCAQKSVILDMRPEARNRPTFGGLRRCVHSIGNLVSGTLLSKDSVALAEHNLHRATNAVILMHPRQSFFPLARRVRPVALFILSDRCFAMRRRATQCFSRAIMIFVFHGFQ